MFQSLGQGAGNFRDQRRAAVDQAAVNLDQAGAGIDFGNRVRA